VPRFGDRDGSVMPWLEVQGRPRRREQHRARVQHEQQIVVGTLLTVQ
jgi:hypothetical protein